MLLYYDDGIHGEESMGVLADPSDSQELDPVRNHLIFCLSKGMENINVINRNHVLHNNVALVYSLCDVVLHSIDVMQWTWLTIFNLLVNR